MAQYYLAKDGQRIGPLSVEQLLQNGLTPESLVWTDGMTDWAPAGNIAELANAMAPAPAPQPVQQPQPLFQQPQPQYQQPQYQQPQYQQPQYQQPQYQQQAMGNYVATPQLGFMDAVKKCFKNYANFNGRARRSEFWWFWLACYIIQFIFMIPLKIFTGMTESYRAEAFSSGTTLSQLGELADKESFSTTMTLIFGIIFAIVMLALLIPQLSAMCRRLHDVGKSGHMMWLFLVCGIGGLVPLILCIPEGKPEPNQYGESPKFVRQQ